MSEWIRIDDHLPERSREVFCLGHLTDEHMRLNRGRVSPYEVASGWYVNIMPHIYTHWMLISNPLVNR